MNRIMNLLFATIFMMSTVCAMDETSDKLFEAAREGDQASLNTLIASGVEVNFEKNGGWTALMWAANRGHLECVRRLIIAGANVNQATELFSKSALMIAAHEGRVECVRVLIAGGARIDFCNRYGETALSEAARECRPSYLHRVVTESDQFAVCELLVEGLLRIPMCNHIQSINALLKAYETKQGWSRNMAPVIRSVSPDAIYWYNRANFARSVAGQAVAALPDDSTVKSHLLAKYSGCDCKSV